MPPNARKWVFTLNNYTAEEWEALKTLNPEVRYLRASKKSVRAVHDTYKDGSA